MVALTLPCTLFNASAHGAAARGLRIGAMIGTFVTGVMSGWVRWMIGPVTGLGSIALGIIGRKTGLEVPPMWRLALKRMRRRKPPRVNRRKTLQL